MKRQKKGGEDLAPLEEKRPESRAEPLVNEIRSLVLECRRRVARKVNSELVMLYWEIGQRVRKDVLQGKRAEYGGEIVQTVSALLVQEFGHGFSRRNLFRRIRFAEVF